MSAAATGLPLGDALCSFTPIYGQGMSVAAMEAEALGRCLADGAEGLTRRYLAAAAKIVDLPWSVTVGGDRALAPDADSQPRMERLLRRYLRLVQTAAHRDAAVAYAFMLVGNLFEAPPSLLHPRIMWRVARHHLLWRAPAAAGDLTNFREFVSSRPTSS